MYCPQCSTQLSQTWQPHNWLPGPQKITVHHGTIDVYCQSIAAGAIQTNIGNPLSDFGVGFYTTTVQQQAITWAHEMAQRLSNKYPACKPAIVTLEIDRDELAKLQSLWFVRGHFNNDDYWSFVWHCRQNSTTSHRHGHPPLFDIVIGPVAAFWRQRLSIYDADQMSFHTQAAARLLNHVQTSKTARIL